MTGIARRRASAGAALVVLLVAGSIALRAAGPPSDELRGQSPAGSTSMDPDLAPSEAGECPARYNVDGVPHLSSRDGTIVSAGPLGAKLCTYLPSEDGRIQLLNRVQDATPAPGRLVEFLNDLPDRAWKQDSFCALAAGESFQIVLSYADRVDTLRVSPNCALVEHDGAVKKLTSLRELRSFWP